jgi:hypothetical protein
VKWAYTIGLLLGALLCSSTGHAQSVVAYNTIALGNAGRGIPNPTVTVCAHVQPPTNPCTGTLITLYSNSALSALTNPFLGDTFGNINFWALPGTYDISIAAPLLPTYTYSVTTGGSGIQTSTVLYTPTLATCATVAGAINIQIPAGTGQAAGIPNQCVALYTAVSTDATRTLVWGENPFVIVPPGQAMGWTVWGSQSDVNITASTTGQAIGYDAVAGGGLGGTGTGAGGYTLPTWAFRAFDALNGAPPWRNGFFCDNPGLTCYGIQKPDTGLQITQSITGSGSPQTITTNAVPNLNRLNTQAYISVDTGVTNQEDVQITNLTNVGGLWSVTGIFTKNHANNTGFFMYSGGNRWWDPGQAVSRLNPYQLGDLRQWVNTSGPLGWGLTDAAGVNRIYDWFLSGGISGSPAGLHIYRSVQTAGWQWQAQSSTPVAAMNDAGDFTQLGGVSTIQMGPPLLVAEVNLATQAISIGATTLYAVPASGAGQYRISCYAVVTQAATVSSSLPYCALTFTDNDTSVVTSAAQFTFLNSSNVVGANSTNQTGAGTFVMNAKASTNILYSTVNYASSGATPMQYALHIRLEYLGP